MAHDASIKGMWCVPKYSNPTGTVYSDAVVERYCVTKKRGLSVDGDSVRVNTIRMSITPKTIQDLLDATNWKRQSKAD